MKTIENVAQDTFANKTLAHGVAEWRRMSFKDSLVQGSEVYSIRAIMSRNKQSSSEYYTIMGIIRIL